MSTWITPSAIPEDFEVRPILTTDRSRGQAVVTCGACGLSWDDSIVTGYTPAPSARCPFEAWHVDDTAVEPEAWPLRSTCLTIDVGRDDEDRLRTVIRFADGSTLVSDEASPDLGFEPEANVLHDVAHAILSCHAGITSPVLERVVEARSLSQYDVDLEEAAVFALQAWVASLLDRDATAAITNAQQSLASAVLTKALS